MAKHVELLGLFKAKLAGSKLDFTKKNDRDLSLQIFIKFADINNSTRPWPIAKVWAERIMEVNITSKLKSLLFAGIFQTRRSRKENWIAYLTIHGP